MDKIWSFSLPDNLKRTFLRATIESVLVYGLTTGTLSSELEKMLDGSYIRMLQAK